MGHPADSIGKSVSSQLNLRCSSEDLDVNLLHATLLQAALRADQMGDDSACIKVFQCRSCQAVLSDSTFLKATEKLSMIAVSGLST